MDDKLVADRYEVGAQLGLGGMGEVVAARDEQLGREVAIKRMRAKTPTEKAMLRFEREARIQGRLDHPAIPPVHELGRDRDGLPFFAMKKLAGTTLAQILAKPDPVRYPRQRLLRALADVCLAVEFAHTRGFVHRDLKPDNIMLGDFGEVHVLDWGVAKVMSDTTPDDGYVGVDSGELKTRDGLAVGTPGYMSPEQADALRDVDGRADVYALGCMLFEILSGTALHPRGAAGLVSVTEGVDGHPAKRSPARDIPPELDSLCAAATTRDRAARIQTARELGAGIQQFLDGDRDVELRRNLAKDHLARATEAFGHVDDEDARRTAIREAGRALALDPTLAAAADLVGRLMLEPPRTIPHEVEVEVELDTATIVRRTAKAAIVAYFGYFAFLPLFFWVGVREPLYIVAMVGCCLANVAILGHHARANTKFHPYLLAAGSALLVLVLARMFSPFLVAPGTAAVTALGLMFGPAYVTRRSALAMIAVMSSAVLLPWLAETAGWISKTLTVNAAGVNMDSPAMGTSSIPSQCILVGYTIALVTIAVTMGISRRDAERSARRTLHLQSWHLRQLVPR
jgi:serine/threonine-protein kinase